MKGRGQASIYIVVGLIILFAVSLGYYLQAEAQEEITEGVKSKLVEEAIPSDLLPFKRYVEQCANELLWEAVWRSGLQGGTIYPEDVNLEFDDLNPTESDGITLFRGGSVVIPYWSYIMGDNECEGSCAKFVPIPPLEGPAPGTISSQMEKYISEHITRCIQKIDAFEPLGIDYEIIGESEFDVEFTTDSVELYVDFPLKLELGDVKSDIRYFTSSVPVSYREHYDNAVFLAIMLDQTRLFEKATINWISLFSDFRSDALPPMASSSSALVESSRWSTAKVKEDLKNIVFQNIPLFTLQGTNNYHPVKDVYDTKYYALKEEVYGNFILPSNDQMSNFDVAFTYNPDWDMYVNLNGGADSVKPETFGVDWLPWFGVNRVRTMYGVSYPVMISLTKPKDVTIDGKGFVFNFAVEANVRNNAPMNADYVPYNYDNFKEFTVGETFFCDDDMRTSENVSFRIVNGATGEGEEGVKMTYVCDLETCDIGVTGENGVFDGALPVCSNGYMQFLKPEFETILVSMSPNIDDKIELGDIIYEPYREINVSLKKIMINKVGERDWATSRNAPIYLTDNEYAIIQLEKIEEESKFIVKESYSTVGMINGSETTIMKLLPGKYNASITGIWNEEVVIPPQERCFDSGFGDEECVMVPEEEIVLDKYSGAGLELNEKTGYLVIDKAGLDSAEKVVFYELFADLPGISQSSRTVEDIEALGLIEEFSAENVKRVQPTYESFP